MIGKKTALEFYAEDPLQQGFNQGVIASIILLIKPIKPIWHVHEYPTMHYLGKTGQT